jgi:predicted ester cyclase
MSWVTVKNGKIAEGWTIWHGTAMMKQLGY